MPLLGRAALAMWWSIAPEHRAEFGDWHSHEHFRERLGIAGFQRGARWRGVGNPGEFFVLYELAEYEDLTSKGYLDRLNAPSPWSTRMMRYFQGMVRSQCRVVLSFGGGIAGSLATIRLSPQTGQAENLRHALAVLLDEMALAPGLTGAHLLITDTPQGAVPTQEQMIRGGDRAADWVVIVAGYASEAVAQAVQGRLCASALRSAGAGGEVQANLFALDFAMTPSDC